MLSSARVDPVQALAAAAAEGDANAAAAGGAADQPNADLDAALEEGETNLGNDADLTVFEVEASKIKQVKARCNELDWPLLEEYDFRNDQESHIQLVEKMPSALFDDTAPSARLVPPRAQAAPTHSRAQPEHLGGSPWPPEPA